MAAVANRRLMEAKARPLSLLVASISFAVWPSSSSVASTPIPSSFRSHAVLKPKADPTVPYAISLIVA